MICCYLLVSNANRTYVGATTNFKRRLRQHNGDLVGGAKATRSGRPWRCVLRVHGFLTFRQALQFEWRFKRRITSKGTPVARRIHALNSLLQRSRWTSNSPPAASVPLQIKAFTSEVFLHLQNPPVRVTLMIAFPAERAEYNGSKNLNITLLNSNARQ